MIKFFRTIRYNLMERGKTSRYLKYAIGEIILVVIGILIALQINNMNQNRVNKNTISKYYTQLLAELKLDNQQINDIILRQENDSIAFKTYEDIYKTDNLSIENVYENLKKISPFYKTMYFNTNTLEVLESTGEIKLLPNNIQLEIVTLKTIQNSYSSTSDSNYKAYGDLMVDAYLVNTASLENKLTNQPNIKAALNFDDKKADQIAKLHAALAYKNMLENLNNSVFRRILKANTSLIKLIEEELK